MTNTRTDIIRDYRKHLKKEVIPAFEKRYTALAQMEFGAWLVANPERTEMLLEDLHARQKWDDVKNQSKLSSSANS